MGAPLAFANWKSGLPASGMESSALIVTAPKPSSSAAGSQEVRERLAVRQLGGCAHQLLGAEGFQIAPDGGRA